MSCEHFQPALIEAGAGATSVGEDLREHLESCSACRAVFWKEQFLFSSVDSGLHATANAEVPASLLPRVRAASWSGSDRGWASAVAFGYSAAMVAVILAVALLQQSRMAPKPVATAKTAGVSVFTPIPAQPEPHLIAVPFAFSSSASNRRASSAEPANSNAVPEVIVPADQEALLARYAEQWQQRKRSPLGAEDLDLASMALLEIAPIQITELDVKLLAEE